MRARAFVLAMTIAAICMTQGHGAHAATFMERQEEFLSLFEEFDWYKRFNPRDEEGVWEGIDVDVSGSNSRLLDRLKEDPYSFGSGPVGRELASRGDAAAAELIRELPAATHYFLLSIVNILADIPSEERDDAFIVRLKEERSKPHHFLKRSYIPIMMMSLSVNGSEAARDVLQEYARREDQSTIRATAGIALNILGNAANPTNGPPNITIAYAGLEELPDDAGVLARKILESLDAHGLLTLDATIPSSGTFKIAEAVLSGASIKLKGTLPEDSGTWSLEIGEIREGRVPVYYEWMTGPLAAAGYAGVLDNGTGEWRAIFWEMVFIS